MARSPIPPPASLHSSAQATAGPRDSRGRSRGTSIGLAEAFAAGGLAAEKELWSKADISRTLKLAERRKNLEAFLIENEIKLEQIRQKAREEGLDEETLASIRAMADGGMSSKDLRMLIAWLNDEGPPPGGLPPGASSKGTGVAGGEDKERSGTAAALTPKRPGARRKQAADGEAVEGRRQVDTVRA